MSRRETLLVAAVILVGLLMASAERDARRPPRRVVKSIQVWPLERPPTPGLPPLPPRPRPEPRPLALLGEKMIVHEVGTTPRVAVLEGHGNLMISAKKGTTLAAFLQVKASPSDRRTDVPSIDDFQLKISESEPGRFKLRVVFPQERDPELTRIQTELKLNVPPGTTLDVDKSGGTVRVTGLRSALSLVGRLCNAVIHDVSGPIATSTEYSDVFINDVDGTVTMKCIGGKSMLSDLRNGLDVDASFSDLSIDRLRGNAEITSEYGKLRSRDVVGLMKVASRSTTVNLSQTRGGLEVKGTDKLIRLSGSGGPVTVIAERCPLVLQEIGGDLTVENMRQRIVVDSHHDGKVVLKTTLCPTIIRNSSGDIEGSGSVEPIMLENCRGEVRLINHDGDIHVLPPRSGSSDFTASTINGNLWVYLPANPSLSLKASAEGGRVEGCCISGLPEIKVLRRGSRLDQVLEGTLGSGRNRFVVTSEAGDIRLLGGERIATLLKRYAIPTYPG